MAQLYSTIYKSVVRAVRDLVEDIKTTTDDPSMRYWSWEARLDEDKLPEVTLIGVNGFDFAENRGLWRIHFGITLSSYEDANLLREADIIDMIHTRFGFESKIALLDPTTGDQFNELSVLDFEVMPMGQTQIRNYRTMAVEVCRTAT